MNPTLTQSTQADRHFVARCMSLDELFDAERPASMKQPMHWKPHHLLPKSSSWSHGAEPWKGSEPGSLLPFFSLSTSHPVPSEFLGENADERFQEHAYDALLAPSVPAE